jgi:hydrogenase maturation protein HypF
VQALLARRGPVDAIAHDLHPDFHSTRVALALADRLGVPAVAVQHHHAHIAAVQAEHGLATQPVIGLALDGVGLGTTASLGRRSAVRSARRALHRVAHLPPLRCPAATSRRASPGAWPRRCCTRWAAATRSSRASARGRRARRRAGVAQHAGRAAELPATSSAGRWFDAAAGAAGPVAAPGARGRGRDRARTAAAHCRWKPARTAGEVGAVAGPARCWPMPARAGRRDRRGIARAARFHLALADGLAQGDRSRAQHGAAQRGAGRRLLLQPRCCHASASRPAAGARPAGAAARRPPCGDAGLALGQAWVAALHARPFPGCGSTTRREETEPCASPCPPAWSNCDADSAVVDLGGVRKQVSMALVPEAQVGDYVIVHVGHAIGVIDPEEAERTLALFAEMAPPRRRHGARRMKYIDEFRDGDLARRIAARIAAEADPAAPATASWSSAAATRTPSRATASPSCCRRTCA